MRPHPLFRKRRPRRNALRFLLLLLLVLLPGGCARKAAPPSPDAPAPGPPSLAGRTVLVLPAHPAAGAAVAPGAEPVPGLDADIAYFLGEEAARVRWVLPPEIEQAAANAPTLRIRPRELAVTAFHRAKLERIGEPLFTHLYALGRLLDARYALVPHSAGYVPGTGGEQGRVEVGVALIDVSDGDVIWIGAVAGSRGPAGDRATVASAASALARMLAR